MQCSAEGVEGPGREGVLEDILSGCTSLTHFQREHQNEECHTA